MRAILLCAALLALPSCTAIKGYATDTAKEVAAEAVTEAIDNYLEPAEAAKIREEADTDKDNRLSWTEIAAYVGGTGGTGGLAFVWWMILRRIRRKLGRIWQELETVKNDAPPTTPT